MKGLNVKENKIWAVLRDNYKLIAFGFVASVLAFLVLISNGLTNTYDGLWKGNYYTEYDWVVSIGRYVWPLTGLLRGHASPEPFTSFVSLLLYVLGGVFIIDMFGASKKKMAFLLLPLVTVNTAVSVALSYRYMSPTFAISFFFAAFAVWIAYTYRNFGWSIGIIFITMTLGNYQANIGCACVLILALIIKHIVEQEDVKNILNFVWRYAAMILLGCLLYKIGWTITTKVTGIEISDYQGANSISIGSIFMNMPKSIGEAYRCFFKYIFENGIKHDFFQSAPIYKIMLLLFVVLVLCWIFSTRTRAKARLVISALLLLLIPVAANVSLLLAPGTQISIQMTTPMAMITFALAVMLVGLDTDFIIEGMKQYLGIALIVISLLFIYGRTLMVSVDQHLMLESREATFAFIEKVYADMERQGVTAGDYEFIFIGTPSANSHYRQDQLWEYANDYARMGNFALGGNCNIQSYDGIFRECGIGVPINYNSEYWHELESNEEIKNMSCYPYDGYLRLIGNDIVVKLSDY